MSKKKDDAFEEVPIVKPVPEKKKDRMREICDEIKKEYGIDVEPSKNIKYKLEKSIGWLNDHFDFRYNIINADFEYRKKGEKDYRFFDDRDYKDTFLAMKLDNIGISDQDFKTIIYGSKVAETFNPFWEFFNGLKPWDGEDHITKFLQQVYLKNEEHRKYFIEGFKKWFTAMVVSLVEDEPHPYKINQTCLVLVGDQGKRKTTFIKNLMPKHLQLKYFYGSAFLVHEKDHEKYLAYKIIINFDEFSAYNKNDIESLKSKITQDQIVLRLPYGKEDIHLKRRASFTATTNNTEFLRDDTGSRRWFVVEIDQIVLDESFDLNQMYAQGLALYKTGTFKFWFDDEDIKKVEIENERFKLKSMEEEMVLKHLAIPTATDMESSANHQYMSATDIANFLADAYQKINVNNTVVKTIGSVLKKYGFVKVSVRVNKGEHPHKLWCVKVTEKSSVSYVAVHEEGKGDFNGEFDLTAK